MNEWILLVIIILLGAVIGGGTNIIAIRMLFRPYKAWFIGNFHVPFTPGLIPKRREEIAENLGRLVETHLVTPEGMQEKISEGVLFEEVEQRLKDGIKELLEEDRTLDEWMEEHLGRKDQLLHFRETIETGLQDKLRSLFNDYKHRSFEEWVPENLIGAVERKIPKVIDETARKGAEWIGSESGQREIDRMLTNYLHSKGNMTSMFSRMAQRLHIAEMISRELKRLLLEKETKELMEELLMEEWRGMLQSTPSEYITEEKLNEQVERMTMTVVGRTPVIGEWSEPLSAWSGRYEELLNKTVVPSVMASASMILSRYMKSIMQRIGIRELVTKEVNTFPLSRLEEMLLLIAKRELKMIAILGALIGSFVGLIQGFLLLFIF
ncbi:DUF445 family protein [Alkalicoccus chagannorensis]|uniref:DUF445 family protein n=1 Tax=Alkalicoccus chagannorensis TaxID=427072 RepID=UPI0004148C42|nr:DUF445 family protein [Alkalicoccus chagannorensis]